MGIKERLRLKKKLDVELSPSEMVSREADRVEHEIVEGLLRDGIQNHLFPPFAIEDLSYDTTGDSYRCRLRAAGKDEKDKVHTVLFMGTIPAEHIDTKSGSTKEWNAYMRTVVQSWIARMTDDLKKQGATKLFTGPRKSSQVKNLESAMKSAGSAMVNLKGETEKFRKSYALMAEQIKVYEAGTARPWTLTSDSWGVLDEGQNPGPTPGELWQAEESIRQSAERQRQRRASKDSA